MKAETRCLGTEVAPGSGGVWREKQTEPTGLPERRKSAYGRPEGSGDQSPDSGKTVSPERSPWESSALFLPGSLECPSPGPCQGEGFKEIFPAGITSAFSGTIPSEPAGLHRLAGTDGIRGGGSPTFSGQRGIKRERPRLLPCFLPLFAQRTGVSL